MTIDGDGAADDGQATDDDAGIGRRDLIKKTLAAAGATGVIWAAPQVTGLSLSPAYAGPGSTGIGFDLPAGGSNFSGQFPLNWAGFSGGTSSYNVQLPLGTHGDATLQISTSHSGGSGPVLTESVTALSGPVGCVMQLVGFSPPGSLDGDGTWAPGVKVENANVATQTFNPNGAPSDPTGGAVSVVYHCL